MSNPDIYSSIIAGKIDMNDTSGPIPDQDPTRFNEFESPHNNWLSEHKEDLQYLRVTELIYIYIAEYIIRFYEKFLIY